MKKNFKLLYAELSEEEVFLEELEESILDWKGKEIEKVYWLVSFESLIP